MLYVLLYPLYLYINYIFLFLKTATSSIGPLLSQLMRAQLLSTYLHSNINGDPLEKGRMTN